jgi:hypothetical protein
MPSNPVSQSELTPSGLTPAEQKMKRDMEKSVPLPDRPAVPLSALLSGRRWRHTARWLGLAIFIIGAALLAYVFYQALVGFQNFTRPDYLSLQFGRAADGEIADRIQGIVAIVSQEVLRVLYLLLLGLLASAIATKGIQFFSASEAVIDEAVAVGIEE